MGQGATLGRCGAMPGEVAVEEWEGLRPPGLRGQLRGLPVGALGKLRDGRRHGSRASPWPLLRGHSPEVTGA